jgi:hypothetical protein
MKRSSHDLVGFAFHRFLPQYQSMFTGPGTHQVQGRLFPFAVKRMPDGLSINGHVTYLIGSQPVSNPLAKTLLKLVGINQHEHPTKSIMRGNAML